MCFLGFVSWALASGNKRFARCCQGMSHLKIILSWIHQFWSERDALLPTCQSPVQSALTLSHICPLILFPFPWRVWYFFFHHSVYVGMKKGRMVKDGCKGSATFSVRFVVIRCTSVTQLGICPASFSCGTYFPIFSVWDSVVFGGMFAPRKDTSVWDQGMQLLKQLHDLTH